MKQNFANFSIKYHGKDIVVSRTHSATGNYYAVKVNNEIISLKGEGVSSILWIEKGKGATFLAAELGRLIERSLHLVV